MSPEQLRTWDEHGYLVFDPDVPDSILEGIIHDLDGLYEGERRFVDGVMYSKNRVMQAWRISENVRWLARAPRVMAVLEELYGRKPLPFQTLDFEYGTEQAPHADSMLFNSIPPGYMCGVWVALEDIGIDNGPIVYYPGSHKLPDVTMQDLGLPASEEHFSGYEKYVADQIARLELKPSYATMEKGQAFVWASNLFHGGAPRKDRTVTRYSQVTHYFFEGCKYYTPVRSEGESIHWRDPAWVAETPIADNRV